MVPLSYWCFRLLRRNIPQGVIDWMLDHGIFLQPGLDTRAPDQSVQQLGRSCERLGQALANKTVCVVGFGGSFGIALALLEAGVRHVILQDPYAPVRRARIRQLDPQRLRRYFHNRDGEWQPDPARITVTSDQLGEYAGRHPASADVVFSSSVLEHVDDVEGLLAACHQLVRPGGLNVHVIDLRDHFFRFPFEMLCYDHKTWQGWLNSSNLNRWRLSDYEAPSLATSPVVKPPSRKCFPNSFSASNTAFALSS